VKDLNHKYKSGKLCEISSFRNSDRWSQIKVLCWLMMKKAVKKENKRTFSTGSDVKKPTDNTVTIIMTGTMGITQFRRSRISNYGCFPYFVVVKEKLNT